VMQDGDSSKHIVEGLLSRMSPEDRGRFSLASTVQPFQGDGERGYSISTDALPEGIPLQNLRALGPVQFSDRPDLSILNLLLFLPTLTLRAETMLNLRAIAVALAAA